MRGVISVFGATALAAAMTVAGQPAKAADAPPGVSPVAQGVPWTPGAKRIDPSAGILDQYKPTMATPRTPDGHPDLTGDWTLGFPSPAGPYGRRAADTFEPDQAVMQRGSAWNKPLYKPEFWSKVEGLDFSEVTVDSVFHCAPAGVPRIGPPSKIIQNAKEVWLFYNDDNTVRIVPIDGRARDPDDEDEETYNGVPLGHWDGDTLVVDTTGYNDITWLRWQGYFHSNQMTVSERIRRDGNLLYWTATVTDPDILLQPWTLDTYTRRLNPNPKAAEPAEASPCKEDDADKIVDRYYRG